MADVEWSAAHWCRERGVGRGSLVGGATQAAAYAYEVYLLTHVGTEVAVGRRVCLVRVYGGVRCEPLPECERAFQFGCQLAELPDAHLAVVAAWLERG